MPLLSQSCMELTLSFVAVKGRWTLPSLLSLYFLPLCIIETASLIYIKSNPYLVLRAPEVSAVIPYWTPSTSMKPTTWSSRSKTNTLP
jgi:hypothetical protein